MTSAAIVMTVRNEQDLLRANVLYHRYLGVRRFYVFLDGTTDRTPETVIDLDYVTLLPSSSRESFLESPAHRTMHASSERLKHVVRTSATHSAARQMLNTIIACERARDEGIDWILSLDPDELICFDPHETQAGELTSFLQTQPVDIEQITFPSAEIVQQSHSYENVFAEATLFKHPDSSVRRSLYDPFKKAVRGHFFYPRKLRRIPLPKYKKLTWWYGHRFGKSAARTSIDLLPRVHTFDRFDGSRELQTRGAGLALHYLLYSADDFMKKYRNFRGRPDTYVSGQAVNYRKKIWIQMVNDPSFSEEFLREYYNRWVAFDDEEIARLRKDGVRSDLLEVTAIRQAFAALSSSPNGLPRETTPRPPTR